MKLAIVKQLGCGMYSVHVDGWSACAQETEDQAFFVAASRLGKLQREINKIRIPFVKI